jgi:hypothetical protein
VEQPRNAPLPPPRRWWVQRMSSSDRRSHLIAEELERLAVARERSESSAIRGFLVAWRKATQGENPAGLELRVVRADVNAAVVVACLPGVGRVRWMPALIVPWNHKFERIGRECGDAPLFPWDRTVKRDAWGEPERARSRPILPGVEIKLISVR